jgi:hypothetical protein
MTVINLDAASWILAKAKIKLQVAASVSLDSHSLLLSDAQDLLTKDVWIHMGHDFHFSFRISFDSMSSIFGVPTENALTDFIASALTQAPVGRVRRNMDSANEDVPVLVAVTPCSIPFCTRIYRKLLQSQQREEHSPET